MKSSPESERSISSTDDGSCPPFTIADYRGEYLKADAFCQEVQSFIDLAGIPAINELRNAGKHLLISISDAGSITSQRELAAAIGHARKACYEAYEAGILSALEIIEKFRGDYSTTVIGDVIPEYVEILKKARIAQKSIESGRQSGFDRAADHTARMEAFRSLRTCSETLMDGREEMNKKVRAERHSARILTWSVWGGIIVALAIAVWTAFRFWPIS